MLKRLLKSLKRILWGKKRRKKAIRRTRPKPKRSLYSRKKRTSRRTSIIRKAKKSLPGKKFAIKRKSSKQRPKPRHKKVRSTANNRPKILRTRIKGTLSAPAKHPSSLTPPGSVKRQVHGNLIGEITHFFSKISVVVIKLSGTITVGDEILIKSDGGQFRQKVRSLQIESVDVRSAGKGHLVGLKVGKKARVGNQVYRLN